MEEQSESRNWALKGEIISEDVGEEGEIDDDLQFMD